MDMSMGLAVAQWAMSRGMCMNLENDQKDNVPPIVMGRYHAISVGTSTNMSLVVRKK